jgi:hypothetical protein
VGEDVYFKVLDNWYLAKHINIAENDIETIIDNMQSLLDEIKQWREENIQCVIREETVWKPHGLIFYTDDKEMADKVFPAGYHASSQEELLKESMHDLSEDDFFESEGESPPTFEGEEVPAEILYESLEEDLPPAEEEAGASESKEELPDDLFDDLEEIGTLTVEPGSPTEEDEMLADDLFDDLEELGTTMTGEGDQAQEDDVLTEDLFDDLLEEDEDKEK